MRIFAWLIYLFQHASMPAHLWVPLDGFCFFSVFSLHPLFSILWAWFHLGLSETNREACVAAILLLISDETLNCVVCIRDDEAGNSSEHDQDDSR